MHPTRAGLGIKASVGHVILEGRHHEYIGGGIEQVQAVVVL